MHIYEPVPRSLDALSVLLQDPSAILAFDQKYVAVVVDKKRGLVCIQYEDRISFEVPLGVVRIFLPHKPVEHHIVESARAFALSPHVHVGGTGTP